MPMPAQRPYRSKQDYCTPVALLDAVRHRFKIDAFAFDFAASAENAVASEYFTEEDNALGQPAWAPLVGHGWGWLNPPFTNIAPWARRCRQMKEHGGRIALLVPASVGANWFRDDIDGHAYVLALNGRLAFMPDKPKQLYPKDCLVALYSPGLEPGFEVWPWKKNTP